MAAILIMEVIFKNIEDGSNSFPQFLEDVQFDKLNAAGLKEFNINHKYNC